MKLRCLRLMHHCCSEQGSSLWVVLVLMMIITSVILKLEEQLLFMQEQTLSCVHYRRLQENVIHFFQKRGSEQQDLQIRRCLTDWDVKAKFIGVNEQIAKGCGWRFESWGLAYRTFLLDPAADQEKYAIEWVAEDWLKGFRVCFFRIFTFKSPLAIDNILNINDKNYL